MLIQHKIILGASMLFKSEDEVRDEAKKVLGFDDGQINVKQGIGQITTFNQLGFVGIKDKPDGWYLPEDLYKVAIILEIKSTKINISSNKFQEELLKNLNILTTKYSHIIGIMYNGLETRVFKFNYGGGDFKECNQTAKTLQHKNYYIRLYTENQINKQQIYNFTKNQRLASL